MVGQGQRHPSPTSRAERFCQIGKWIRSGSDGSRRTRGQAGPPGPPPRPRAPGVASRGQAASGPVSTPRGRWPPVWATPPCLHQSPVKAAGCSPALWTPAACTAPRHESRRASGRGLCCRGHMRGWCLAPRLSRAGCSSRRWWTSMLGKWKTICQALPSVPPRSFHGSEKPPGRPGPALKGCQVRRLRAKPPPGPGAGRTPPHSLQTSTLLPPHPCSGQTSPAGP